MNFSNCSLRIAFILLVCLVPGLVAMDLLPMLENFFGSLGWKICKNKCVENPTPELIDFMLNPPQVTNGTTESTTEEHMDFIPVPPQEFVPTLETTNVESTVPAEYDSTTFSGTSTTSFPTIATSLVTTTTTTPMPTTLPVTTTTTPKPTTLLTTTTTTPKPTTPLPPTTIAPAMQPREAEAIIPEKEVQFDHRGFTAWTLILINLSLLILIILVVLAAYFYGSKRNRPSSARTTTADTNEQVEMVPLTSVTSTTDSSSSPDQVEETEIGVNDDSPATDAAVVAEGEQEEPESVPVPHGRLTRMRIRAARNAFLNDQSLAVTTQRGPLCPWFP